MIGAICERLNALEAAHDGAALTGGLVIGIDQDPAAKVTQILFDRQGRPRVVAKVARQAGSEQALVAEHRALAELAARALPTAGPQLPRPLLLERVRGRLVLATTMLPGAPLSTRYYRPGHVQRPGPVAGDFAAAGSWLERFQRETRGAELVLGPDAYDEWVRPPFDRYRAVLGWSEEEDALLQRLAGACRDLRGVTVPLVAVHGDYAIANLLVEDARVSGVVDWELGRPAGLPFQDLFKFAASYGSFLDRAVPVRGGALAGHPGWAEAQQRWGGLGDWTNLVGFLYAYLGRGWFPELVRGYVRRHCARLGLPTQAVAVFLPVFLAQQVMTLENPRYRHGYRTLLQVLAREDDAAWLRQLEEVR